MDGSSPEAVAANPRLASCWEVALFWPHVAGVGANEAVGSRLFADVRGPAGHAREGEGGREEVGRWAMGGPSLSGANGLSPGQFENHHRQREVSSRVIAMAQDEAERRVVAKRDLADEVVVLGNSRRDLLEHG